MKNKIRPLILVSNDDGYLAPGLESLINMVKNYGDVIAVTPEKGESGMSHAITITTPLRATLVKKEENITIYKVNGTPVDCVKLAINQLLPRKPDILVSGINHGSNSSVSIMYSGTMGAAREGCLYGIPSVGFSLCDHSMSANFNVAEKHGEPIFKHVLENGLPNQTCLNVNFPIVDESNFNGVKVCRQAKGFWQEEYQKRTDPHGGSYYWLTGKFANSEIEASDTDEWALNNNFASVVPIQIDVTNKAYIKELDFLNKKTYEK